MIKTDRPEEVTLLADYLWGRFSVIYYYTIVSNTLSTQWLHSIDGYTVESNIESTQ